LAQRRHNENVFSPCLPVIVNPCREKQRLQKPTGEIPPPKEEPRVIEPGPPPSDAIVLFDGKDLSQWKGENNGPANWDVKDGVATVNGTGSISTKQEFGDCQLHVEWATPQKVEGEGQGRGNSGILLQGRYEVQVLDSYINKTYYQRTGRLRLQAVCSAGERVPQTGRVADVRYYFSRAEVRCGWQIGETRNGDGVTKRSFDSGQCGNQGEHWTCGRAEVSGASVEAVIGVAGSS